MDTSTLCTICEKPITIAQLQAGGQEIQQTAGGLAHADCYYDAVGKEIEEHPIGPGSIKRG